MCGKSVYMLCIVTVDGDDGVVEAEGEDFMTEIESALSQDRQASNGEWEKLLQAAKSAGTLSNTYTVKPVLAVTSIKQPTCLKQPIKMFPNVNFVLIFTSIKQPPALSSLF